MEVLTRFFLPMEPPTATAQEKQVRITGSRPVFYNPASVKAARNKITAHLAKEKPVEPYTGALQLVVKWCFPVKKGHHDGEYRATRPDTDNLQKLLKDCMTECSFWHDDAQVASEIAEKFWSDIPGIFIQIGRL